MKFLQICPPHRSDVATLPWEIPKNSFSTVLFIHTSDNLCYLRRKQTVIHLPIPPENVTTLTGELQKFSSDWRFVAVFQMLEALKRASYGLSSVALKKELVVICGNWNVRQAMPQQVFRVTTFWINTCFQSFPTLFGRIVHNAVLKFSHVTTSRCRKPQHVHINTRAPPVA